MTTIKTEEKVQNILKHWGVLGMRWGYRKDRTTGRIRKTTPAEKKQSRKYAKGRSEEKSSGGSSQNEQREATSTTRRGSSEDAAKAREYEKIARRSGISALSNSELRALNDRMNLEINYNQRLGSTGTKAGSTYKKGKKIAKEVLEIAEMANKFAKFIDGPIGTQIKKKAAK